MRGSSQSIFSQVATHLMKTIVAERLCGFQGRPEGELGRLDRTAKQSQVRQVDQTRQRPDPSLFVTRHGISREASVPLKYFRVKCMGSWLSGVRDDFQDFPPIFHALQCHGSNASETKG